MDFLDIFEQFDDLRNARKKPEILLLTLCAVICGSESGVTSKHLVNPN